MQYGDGKVNECCIRIFGIIMLLCGGRAEKGMKNPVGEAIAWRDAGECILYGRSFVSWLIVYRTIVSPSRRFTS